MMVNALSTAVSNAFGNLFSLASLFRLANFAIFIAFMIYLYRRYLKDFITQQMKADALIVEGLIAEQAAAARMHEQYAHQVAQKKEEHKRLQQRIEQWRKEVEREHADRLLEKNNRLRARKQKAELQIQQLRKEVIARRVMPEAVRATRQQLHALFTDEKEGNTVIQSIISSIKKSNVNQENT